MHENNDHLLAGPGGSLWSLTTCIFFSFQVQILLPIFADEAKKLAVDKIHPGGRLNLFRIGCLSTNCKEQQTTSPKHRPGHVCKCET